MIPEKELFERLRIPQPANIEEVIALNEQIIARLSEYSVAITHVLDRYQTELNRLKSLRNN